MSSRANGIKDQFIVAFMGVQIRSSPRSAQADRNCEGRQAKTDQRAASPKMEKNSDKIDKFFKGKDDKPTDAPQLSLSSPSSQITLTFALNTNLSTEKLNSDSKIVNKPHQVPASMFDVRVKLHES